MQGGPNIIRMSLRNGREGRGLRVREDMMRGAKSEWYDLRTPLVIVGFEDGWKGHESKKAGASGNWKRQGNNILLKSLQKGTQPCLEFSPVRTVSDFICVVSSYPICGNLLQHSQETNNYIISQCPVVCGVRPARCIVEKQPSDWLMLHAEG